MSDFPEAILVPKNYEDKGNPFTENDQINTSSEIVLQHYAQLRTVRSDGTVIASSVSVNYNGQVYTEIFTSPVPAGNYFYSYDDPTQQTTILLFNSAQSQSISLQVNYITRGDIITGARATQVETDLAAVENSLGLKTAVLQSGVTSGGTVAVPIDATRISIPAISSITVLLSAVDGSSGHGFTIAGDNSAVTIVCGTATIHYLFIVHIS